MWGRCLCDQEATPPPLPPTHRRRPPRTATHPTWAQVEVADAALDLLALRVVKVAVHHLQGGRRREEQLCGACGNGAAAINAAAGRGWQWLAGGCADTSPRPPLLQHFRTSCCQPLPRTFSA